MKMKNITSLSKHLKSPLIISSSDALALSFSEFQKNYLKLKIPCVIEGLTQDWPASQTWNLNNMLAKYGSRRFECGWIQGEPQILTLSQYHQFINPLNRISLQDHSKNRSFEEENLSPYLFDSTFETDCPELLGDIRVPQLFHYPWIQTLKMNFRWLIIGYCGSGSMIHIDPATTHAWNALFEGEKLWLLVNPKYRSYFPGCPISPSPISPSTSPPSRPPFSFLTLNDNYLFPWFNQILPHFLYNIPKGLEFLDIYDPSSPPSSSPSSAPSLPPYYLFIQKPGQIVYVPRGWPHATLNLAPSSIALTQNFFV